jgi:hypothetical protein
MRIWYTFALIGTTELLTEKMDAGLPDPLANNLASELATSIHSFGRM